jgi:hypothetical protein
MKSKNVLGIESELNTSLTNQDIDRYAKSIDIKHYRGTFARNLLPNKIKKDEKGIVNLDSSDGTGTHWVAYCIANGEKAYYFDSYGLNPPNEILKYTKKDLLINTFQLQPLGSKYCGFLCLLFLKLIEKHTFEDTVFFLSRIKFGNKILF